MPFILKEVVIMDILSKFISHNKTKYICAPATGKIVHLQFPSLEVLTMKVWKFIR